ncbi:HAD-IIIC family phosphatase [Actinoplanes sp. NPDC026619]|uniref:HAD-IIIC family phosphatase n=1 Tax=Actinoplanes sp. NPDC026619 TaxID=3155798 RepID=UPI0033CE8F0F
MTISTDTPATDLLALHRAGELAVNYPKVPGLLAELDAAGLTRAGHVLARLDPDEVRRHHPGTPVVGVAVTGHGTLSALVPALTAELARHGLLLRPTLGNFGSYLVELSDLDSAIHRADPDVVMCVLDPVMVLEELPLPWNVEDVRRALDEKVALVTGLAARFESARRGHLVVNTLPLPRAVTAQLVDYRSRARVGAAWREANAALLRLADVHQRLVVLDLDPILAEGVPAAEPRLSTYAKAHLSTELLAEMARAVGHLARNLTGQTKKCLVLDLDNTIWGGVLGDDGMDGIEVEDTYRGQAYRAFQRVAKQLSSQGILLAAASKNNPEPVREVLRSHPGMVLREHDFVRVSANWRPKHDNLSELARALNLGVDSFVFVDDSAYECGLIRTALPGVAVVHLDEDPALNVQCLLRDGWFDTREVTDDDRARPARYRDEVVRQDFLQTFDSIQNYLDELGVRVDLAETTERDVPRVSQLTLRTNQFNLTTRRMQPADVRAWADAPDSTVLSIRSADRFGDNGLVGAIFLRRGADGLHVENMLLSCRVFARGIEQACLAAVLGHARDEGDQAVYGSYRPTVKNGIVADFFTRYGFQRAGTAFRHDLRDIDEPPEHVSLTLSFPRSTP